MGIRTVKSKNVCDVDTVTVYSVVRVLTMYQNYMKKYLLIYRSPKEAMERYDAMSEEEINEVMSAWMKWKDSHGDAIVDFGNPVGQQHIVTLADAREGSDDVSGYSIIQAEDIEAAKKILEKHPSLVDDDGSTISMYPIHEM